MIDRSARLTAPLLLAGLAACVSVQPTLSTKATPEANSAYVAGVFSRNEGTNFGFGLLNTETQQEFVLSFGKSVSAWKANQSDLNLIAVPPGEYRIEKWVTFGNVDAQGHANQEFQKLVESTSKLGAPFKVGAGQILHLGAMAATSKVTTTGTGVLRSWNIDPVPLTYPDAAAGIAAKYPAFANQLVICLFCDPATGPQQPGLGTYDPKKLMAAIGEARAATAAMKAFWEPRRAQLEPLGQGYQKLNASYEKEERQAYRAGLKVQLDMKFKEFWDLKTKLDKEYQAERDRLAKPIWAHVDTLAEELRVDTKLAKIVSKNAEVWTGVDVTDELVKRYEARWPSPNAPPPEPAEPKAAPAAAPAPAASAPANAAPAP